MSPQIQNHYSAKRLFAWIAFFVVAMMMVGMSIVTSMPWYEALMLGLLTWGTSNLIAWFVCGVITILADALDRLPRPEVPSDVGALAEKLAKIQPGANASSAAAGPFAFSTPPEPPVAPPKVRARVDEDTNVTFKPGTLATFGVLGNARDRIARWSCNTTSHPSWTSLDALVQTLTEIFPAHCSRLIATLNTLSEVAIRCEAETDPPLQRAIGRFEAELDLFLDTCARLRDTSMPASTFSPRSGQDYARAFAQEAVETFDRIFAQIETIGSDPKAAARRYASADGIVNLAPVIEAPASLAPLTAWIQSELGRAYPRRGNDEFLKLAAIFGLGWMIGHSGDD
jgi:hypothetical protein